MSRTVTVSLSDVVSKRISAIGKKIQEKLSEIPPEDRAYLLPFGAEADRVKLEKAMVSYEPLSLSIGHIFPSPLRTIKPAPLLLAARSTPAPGESPQEDVFTTLSSSFKDMGFETNRRALPEGASVLVFDLFTGKSNSASLSRQR